MQFYDLPQYQVNLTVMNEMTSFSNWFYKNVDTFLVKLS